MTMQQSHDLYYDPFDTKIDEDPHPLWKRMRDEAPLYHNEKYSFYALSRFDDVQKGLTDWTRTAPAGARRSRSSWPACRSRRA